jgi:diguanylate cyclase (GGDEF)-like protein
MVACYGGDEFALVLPEVGAEIAQRVIRWISERLSGDGEFPAVSASAGAAVYPVDGDTVERLLGAADRALYRMKGSPNGVKALTRIAACF